MSYTAPETATCNSVSQVEKLGRQLQYGSSSSAGSPRTPQGRSAVKLPPVLRGSVDRPLPATGRQAMSSRYAAWHRQTIDRRPRDGKSPGEAERHLGRADETQKNNPRQT